MKRWIFYPVAALCLAGIALATVAFIRPEMFMARRPSIALEDAALSVPASVEKAPSMEGQWPRFRGPLGNGVSDDKTLSLEWSDSENLLWKTALPGPGASSPIIWNDRVYLTCYSGYGDGSEGPIKSLERHLLCLETATGKILWKKTVPAVQPEDPFRGYIREHGYASSTPVTDGEHVFVFFGKSGVYCFDRDGNEKWQTSVGTKSGNRRWGSAASPILYRDMVIVNASEESRAIWALDKKTGKEIWKAEGGALELSYGTPLVFEGEKGKPEVILSLPSEVWGLNPATGKLLWHAETEMGGNISPSVVMRGDVLFATGGYPGKHTSALRAGGRGDVTKSNILWTSSDASYVPSPIVHGDHLYLVTDQGIAVCLDVETGNQVHRERLALKSGESSHPVYASPILADGKIFAVTRRSGTFILEATPQMKRLRVNKLESDDSDFNAAPAVSRGKIYLRSNKYLYCLGRDKPVGKDN